MKFYNREFKLVKPVELIRLISVLLVEDRDLIIDHIRHNLERKI